MADPKILTGDQVTEYLTCTLSQKRKALCLAWVYEALKVKIDCARKFFKKLEDTGSGEKVKYEVITDYDKLMSAVGKPAAGKSGAYTQASLTNDGSVTFMLEV